jgi:galactose oxidase
MALGNVWHLPANPEPPQRGGMRDPVFPTTDTSRVTISTGNQFAGAGNPGNELELGSSLLYRLSRAGPWTEVPMAFVKQAANNKYYAADIPVAGLPAGALVEYYVRIAYDDHDTTFVLAAAGGTTSATSATEAAAQAAPFSFNVGTLSQRGRWEPPFPLPNVAVHAHVLPSSKVLMWGRRDSPDQSLNVDPPTPLTPNGPEPPPATCTPFIWDPATREATPTPQPTLGQSGTLANLFCSGHALLPDGRLLVAGGHLSDGAGLTLVTLYDGASDTWTPSSSMVNGRWYPTLVPLADGSVLILSGSYRNSQ